VEKNEEETHLVCKSEQALHAEFLFETHVSQNKKSNRTRSFALRTFKPAFLWLKAAQQFSCFECTQKTSSSQGHWAI